MIQNRQGKDEKAPRALTSLAATAGTVLQQQRAWREMEMDDLMVHVGTSCRALGERFVEPEMEEL